MNNDQHARLHSEAIPPESAILVPLGDPPIALQPSNSDGHDDAFLLDHADAIALLERIRALAESERAFRLLAENASDAVVRLCDGAVAWASPSLTAMTGWSVNQWVDRPYFDFVHPHDCPDVAAAWSATGPDRSTVHRYRLRSADGHFHWVEGHCRCYVDNGHRDGLVESFRVVDDVVAAERELNRRACFDDLTGLLNRQEILDRLHAPTDRRHGGTRSAILFCDVDGLKGVNDSHGHMAGDALLRHVARHILACVRAGDLAARLGGDEFLVVLRHIDTMRDATAVAEKIRAAVSAPVKTRSRTLSASLSIGVTEVVPGIAIIDQIAAADCAMYQAKRAGRNQVFALDRVHQHGA